ncbi:unnamed protein product [Anisakis simplex]|uniref:VWFA domain-containing protein n=1 Tax=Anisakis simplex TaxID=6269 RepID=A0A0M3K4X8_ANISI|nr:unnamed protein product [Anisakis simplex]
MPNDKSDHAKRDVLFLLDTSASIGEGQFDRAIELIRGTVKGFRNIGPDGTQVNRVIQYVMCALRMKFLLLAFSTSINECG